MKANHRQDFMEATENEIKYWTTEDAWELLSKLSLPTSANIIRLVFSFKIKRKPFQILIKHEALLFVHGGMK